MHFQQLPRKWKVEFKTSSLTFASRKLGTQARNQLGTPRGAKSFLRGAQIFYTMSNIFFQGEAKNFLGGLCPPASPWLRACGNLCVFFFAQSMTFEIRITQRHSLLFKG